MLLNKQESAHIVRVWRLIDQYLQGTKNGDMPPDATPARETLKTGALSGQPHVSITPPLSYFYNITHEEDY